MQKLTLPSDVLKTNNFSVRQKHKWKKDLCGNDKQVLVGYEVEYDLMLKLDLNMELLNLVL